MTSMHWEPKQCSGPLSLMCYLNVTSHPARKQRDYTAHSSCFRKRGQQNVFLYLFFKVLTDFTCFKRKAGPFRNDSSLEMLALDANVVQRDIGEWKKKQTTTTKALMTSVPPALNKPLCFKRQISTSSAGQLLLSSLKDTRQLATAVVIFKDFPLTIQSFKKDLLLSIAKHDMHPTLNFCLNSRSRHAYLFL